MTKRKNKIIGIYKITNLVNGKMYIGSSIDIRSRWRGHKNDLKNNRHGNRYLQRSWDKHEEENFKFEIIEILESHENIFEREQFYMDKYKSYEREYGYNISPVAGSCLGIIHTEETREKISAQTKGELNKASILSDNDIKEIRLLLKFTELTLDEIAKMYNTIFQNISGIKLNKSWSHIKTEDENLPKYLEEISKEVISNRTSVYKKLTIEDVITIKKMLSNGNTLSEISKIYNVSSATIGKIKSGETWRGVDEDISKEVYTNLRNSRLTEKEVREIKVLLKENNLTKQSISDMYNVTRNVITTITSGKRWKHVEI